MLSASACNSIADGSFSDPATWDCGCIPSTCDSINIGHVVNTSDDLVLSSLFIQIFPDGQLILEGGLLITGGTNVLLNHGVLSAARMEIHVNDSTQNLGSIVADTLLIYEGDFVNRGSLTAASFFGAAFFPTMPHVWNFGQFQTGNLFCARNLGNEGSLSSSDAHFAVYYSSSGTFLARSVFIQGNLGVGQLADFFVTDTLRIVQDFENYGFVQCGHFQNGWTLGDAVSQVFSGGVLQCGSFFNRSGCQIRGPGTVCISGHSENHGVISGPITICDISLENPISPYVDDNQGTYLLPVYNCGTTACATVGSLDALNPDDSRLYPSPTSGSFIIQSPLLLSSVSAVVRDGTGRERMSVSVGLRECEELYIGNLSPGIYSVELRDPAHRRVAMFQVMLAQD